MKTTDVVIIGAGAAGLMAAYILVKAGRTVTVLEARDRPGGRIHTFNDGRFSHAVELGAEFVHGDLPVTLELLKEAGIGASDVGFEMWQYHNGKFEQSEEFVEGWDGFLEKLNQLEKDMPVKDFIEQNFPDEKYAGMRTQIENYVAGYDTADTGDASAFALRREWNNEDEDAQHRPNGGYGAMMRYLENAIRDAGSSILFDTVVREVEWGKDTVRIVTENGAAYQAAKAIIAMPLGVLQAPGTTEGAVQFQPSLPRHAAALKDIGFGSVIKILLEFDEIFWESDAVTKMAGKSLSSMGFLFSDEAIPTYWTQSPAHSPLLTGWLGGPPAFEKKDTPAELLLKLSLASLGTIFSIDPEVLKNKLVAWHVANWTAEPYTRGSYAYDKVESPQARQILEESVENTLYFAGEYLYDGPAIGTVEAALTSGKKVAERLLKD